jgi:Flagellar biosynthesis protein, FliO
MNECGREVNELRIIEAFTLGGNLAKEAPAAGSECDSKLQTRTEWSGRRTQNSGRRAKRRFKHASLSGRSERKNALARKILTGGAVSTANAGNAEHGPVQKTGWLAGLRTSGGFGAILKKAMQVKPVSVAPAEEEREATWSIRIVLPARSALGLKTVLHELAAAWNWTWQQLKSRQTRKRLRVCETVSLGEKRLVALVEIDGEQFLLGGASGALTTIARLEPSQTISEALEPRWTQDAVQA